MLTWRTSLVVQWLRPLAPNAWGTVLIPAWGTHPMCYAAWPKINKYLFFNVDISLEFIEKHSQVSSCVLLQHRGLPASEGWKGTREVEVALKGSGLFVKLSSREKTDHGISLICIKSRKGKCWLLSCWIVKVLNKWCFMHCQPSLIAHLVKNLPVMQETSVQFLGQEDPLAKGEATHSSILRLPLWLSW